MIVKEAMQRSIIKVASAMTVAEAARIMDRENIGCVLVSESDNVVGIMTESDILRKAIAAGKNCEEVFVKEIMSPSLITIDAEVALDEANDLMMNHKIRRLVVTKDKKIVGIITIRDIAEGLKYSSARRLTGTDEGDYSRLSYR